MKRMAVSFLSAVGMVILVVSVLYAIVAALLRQKKIADMKTDFANNITHELKTPLSTAGIIIRTLGMIDPVKDRELFGRQLASLEKQHQKITTTVDWVLESAMEHPPRVVLEEITVKPWLDELVLHQRAAAHQVLTECDSDARIVSDKNVLAGILGNLLDNAIRYGKTGVAIAVRFYTRDGKHIFEVEDRGSTIPPRHRPYLFEKFYRIPEEQDRHQVKGLGLGLYLCRKNAAALGGHVSYRTVSGGGNCFQLTLPGYER